MKTTFFAFCVLSWAEGELVDLAPGINHVEMSPFI